MRSCTDESNTFLPILRQTYSQCHCIIMYSKNKFYWLPYGGCSVEVNEELPFY